MKLKIVKNFVKLNILSYNINVSGPGDPGMSPMHDTPLNPSMASSMGQGFDPISSMAQMSQQLSVSSASGPPQGPPDCNMDAGMMNMGRPNGMGPGGPGGPMGPGDMPGGPPGGFHDMGDPRMMGKKTKNIYAF